MGANLFDLGGKVAIVTGASRGIGAAMAVALAEAGASLLLVSRGVPDPDVVAALDKAGRPYAHHAADLAEMSSIAPTVEAAVKQFGRIDILVNNAGIIRRGSFLDYSEADWDAVLNVDLKIPVFLAQACVRQMLAQESQSETGSRGKIINVCSLLSQQGGILVLGYTAAKHGLAGVTKLIANELAPQRINVNGVAPGYIRTKNNLALQNDPVRYKAILERIPAGRWGEPPDLAGVAVFLASPASDYMTGELVTVDGGWMAR